MLCLWIRRLNIVKLSVLPDLIYGFNVTPLKISASYFVIIDKLILKLITRYKRLRIAKIILEKRNKVRELTLYNLKC